MNNDEIRDSVNDELRRRGMSRYRLAVIMEERDVCERSAIYRWLRGSNDTTTSVASEALSTLELEVSRR
tara:strand:+ start:5193 stop:5399 length:207 start_codon:yes stop_codon:yes gene_type:complete